VYLMGLSGRGMGGWGLGWEEGVFPMEAVMKTQYGWMGMMALMVVGLGLGGCASEPEREWFTADLAGEQARMDRLRPIVRVADQAAADYLAHKGFQEPAEALVGYDRAYLEETREGRKVLSVMYTHRKLDPDMRDGVARFRVMVDEENKKAVVLGAGMGQGDRM
jgi:hypothetical protein